MILNDLHFKHLFSSSKIKLIIRYVYTLLLLLHFFIFASKLTNYFSQGINTPFIQRHGLIIHNNKQLYTIFTMKKKKTRTQYFKMFSEIYIVNCLRIVYVSRHVYMYIRYCFFLRQKTNSTDESMVDRYLWGSFSI